MSNIVAEMWDSEKMENDLQTLEHYIRIATKEIEPYEKDGVIYNQYADILMYNFSSNIMTAVMTMVAENQGIEAYKDLKEAFFERADSYVEEVLNRRVVQ